MELRHLRYFVAVAEAENITRAAAQLRVAQPAVSRQIRGLEEELGVALLDRSAKSVRLTDAGRLFLKEACAVLARAGEAVAAVRALAGRAGGELQIGYAPSLTVQLLPRTLRRFQSEHPGIRVLLNDLSTEEMVAALRAGKLALGLMAQAGRAMLKGLESIELARYAVCILVPPGHAFAELHHVSPAQAVREPLVAYCRKDYPEYHRYLEVVFARSRQRPRVVEEHDGVASLTASVESGRGLAVVPECLSALVGNRLKLVPFRPAPPATILIAAWKANALSSAADSFVKLARNL